MTARISVCIINFYIQSSFSLKDKRSSIKSLLTRLNKEFNVSVAEIGHLDKIQSAEIAIVMVSNDGIHNQKSLMKIIDWIELHYPELMIMDSQIEMI